MEPSLSSLGCVRGRPWSLGSRGTGRADACHPSHRRVTQPVQQVICRERRPAGNGRATKGRRTVSFKRECTIYVWLKDGSRTKLDPIGGRMKLARRDWRTIASYRGVGAVKHQRGLIRCLREQRSPRERADYHQAVALGILAALAAWLVGAWHGHPTLGLFLALGVYGAAYQRVDPIDCAQRCHLADRETELWSRN